MKRLAVFGLALLGIALIWIISPRDSADLVSGDAPTPPARALATPPADTVSSSDAPSIPALTEINTRDVADNAALLAPAAEQFAFVVIDGRTKQAVPDAEVHWADAERDLSPGVGLDDVIEDPSVLHSRDIAFLETHALAYGHSTRSDSAGHVQFPVSNVPIIFVRSGNLVGSTASLGSDFNGTTLELWPDGDLHVRVLDSAGASCANVGVRLISSYGDPMSGQVVQVATTDAMGVAQLRHAFATIADEIGRYPTQTWRVDVEALPASDASHALDTASLPVEPITIQLPATGIVELSLRDRDGSPLASGLPAILAEVDTANTPRRSDEARLPQPGSAKEPKQIEARIVNGKAVFEHVGLGRQLLACASRSEGSQVNVIRFAGPTASGERLRVELVLGADSVILTGRVLDPEGRAMASSRVFAELFSAPTPSRKMWVFNGDPDDFIACRFANVLLDDRGAFCIEYATDAAHGGTPILLFREYRKGSTERSKTLDLQELWTPGVHDVGELKLDTPPILAAGTVVDSAGAPIENAEVAAYVPSGRGFSCTTDAHGAFELHFAEPLARVGIRVKKVGWAPIRNRTGEPGRADWRIELEHACKIVAHVRAPAGSEISAFGIHVQQTNHVGTETAPNCSRDLMDDGEFEWDECPPGVYALTLHTVRGYDSPPLVRIDGIVVRVDETTDVGLIDLSDTSRVIVVGVLDPQGDELQEGACAFGPDGSKLSAELWSVPFLTQLEKGKLHLARNGSRVDVAIAARGARSRLFPDVQDGDSLRLEPGLPIEISIENPISRPTAGTRFSICLIRADLDPRALTQTRLDWYTGAVDEHGEAKLLAPAPGRYIVRWVMEQFSLAGWSQMHWQDPPQYIDVADSAEMQHFGVHCPIDPATAWKQD